MVCCLDHQKSIFIYFCYFLESLIRIRNTIPSQFSQYNDLLIQRQLLEEGQFELSTWLDKAEALLNSVNLDGGQEYLQALLERHKV